MEVSEARCKYEEVANAATHGIGLLLALAGLAVLVALAVTRGQARHVVSCTVYGVTLVLVYAASTLYHSLRGPRVKHVFRILDHSSIYLLIAGTYTPFTLVNLRGGWGWILFGVVWGLSVCGILFKVFRVNQLQALSASVYVLMGWLALIAIKPLLAVVHSGGIGLLLAGGVFYTFGLVFFAWKRLPYNHAIWHLFVLAGSACHYLAVTLYVLPHRA